MRVDLTKLAYKTGAWKVPQCPSIAWRAWEMSSYSVQEAGSSEQRGLIMPTQSQAEVLEAAGRVVGMS